MLQRADQNAGKWVFVIIILISHWVEFVALNEIKFILYIESVAKFSSQLFVSSVSQLIRTPTLVRKHRSDLQVIQVSRVIEVKCNKSTRASFLNLNC